MTLRGVAIGAGYFSQYHFDAWERTEGVKLTAVASLDGNQAKEAAARHCIPESYDDVARMLDEQKPDFVDIITPPFTHLDLVKLAAERGIAILCQKNLAPSTAEARKIVDIAARHGVRLMVHDNFRFQPWHREIRKLLDGGVIGGLQTLSCHTRLGDGWGPDAYLARQPYFRDMQQLLIFETGVHFIDVYRYLAGEISHVYAQLRRLNPVIKGEDAALVLFEFFSGAAGLWDADRYHESDAANPRYTFGNFLIEGEEGGMRIDNEGAIFLRKLGRPEVPHPYVASRAGFAGDCVAATFEHFIARLKDGAPFETSGEQYLRTLAVQDAIYASAASGARTPVHSE
jgi:predicted dehydrogenase